jgi:hypothetical protein
MQALLTDLPDMRHEHIVRGHFIVTHSGVGQQTLIEEWHATGFTPLGRSECILEDNAQDRSPTHSACVNVELCEICAKRFHAWQL